MPGDKVEFMNTSMTEKDFIFGTRPVLEAIESGAQFNKILIQRDLKNEHIHQIRQLAKTHDIYCQTVPPEKLSRFTRKNHQGIIGLISPIRFQNTEELVPRLFEEGKTPLLVILDGVTDVRNLGSIARSAEALGAHGIIVPDKESALINGDAVKASAGALFNLPVCRERHFGNILEFLSQSGIRLVACSEKADDLAFTSDLQGPLALVMGSEESGIHAKTMERCDVHVKIPLSGKTASLNVAVATGMMLYEVSRQRSINE